MRKLKLFLGAKAANTPPRGISKASRVIFSVLTLLLLSIGQMWAVDPVTVPLSISDYATANSWVNETVYSSVTIDANVTASVSSGSNTGKYYSSNHSWRVYESESGTITISTTSGTLSSVTFTYGKNNNGVILDGTTQVATGSAYDISGTSKTFSVGHSSGTKNGNVQIQSISVTYTPAGGSTPTLTGVTVSGTPTKKEYSAGDNFDPAGLTVTGTYSDASPAPITSGITWSYNPSQTLVKDQTSIGVVATVSSIASAEYNVTGLTVTAASPKITITQNEVADFAATYAQYTWTAGGVSGKLYAYKNAGMQFNPSKTGYYVYNTDPIPGRITKITMTKASGTDRSWTPYVSTTAMTSASGTALDAQTVTTSGASWDVTGSNSYFYLTVSGGATVIGSIVIEYTEDAPPAIDAPSISGDVNFVGSTTVTISHEDADHIYYTTNGVDPTTSSTEYTAPFVVNADGKTTVKAIAVKGSDVSEVASKGFTKVEALESLAALLEATTSTETAFNVVVTDWVVTGVYGTRAWIADAANENGILLYKSGHGFEAGNKLNGVVLGTKTKLFQGFPELTSLVSSDVTVTAAEAVTPRTTTIAALTSGYNAEQGTVVKLEDLTYSSATSMLSDGENSIAADNKLFSSLALVDGTTYDITGVVEYLDGSVVKIMPRSADDVEAKSSVVIPTAANLAALKAAERGTYIVTLTNAVVSYVNGKNVFIEEGTTGALIYLDTHSYEAGDCLNGDYQVNTTDYQGKFEITAIEPQTGAATTTADIPLTTVSIATLNENFASYESRRVKIEGADVTDAISGSDRNGAINDGAALAVYAGVASTITLTANDNVDIIGYPGFHNTDEQLTVWAQADITVNEKVTVRFFAPSSWENVYVNTWDGTDNGQHAMTAVGEGNWYQCKIEKGAPFLFYNGSWNGTNQTVDIAALTEDKCFMGTLPETEGDKISVAEVANCAATYFIAGSENLTGQNWQHIALNEGNTITFNNVAAGEHQFKITNGTWYWSIGLANASATGVTLWNGGDNVGFTTTAAMNITITYNPATNTITVAAEAVPDNVEWSTIKYYSNGSLFATKENIPQGQAYTIDLAETPWRPGYNFAGWSADEIAEASEFTTPLTTITPDADEVTLYAVFSKEITPGSANYVKVTATEDITDGQYLIVYEDGNVAFNGGLETLDAVSNTIGVEIEEDKIASNTTTDAAAFTIDVTNGTVKSASNFYIGVTSYGNGLKQNASADTYSAHSFSINGDGNAIISLNDNWTDNMILNYNSNTNDKRFRYYKGGSQKAIQLYKKVVTPGTYSYTTAPATIYHIAGTPALTGEGTAEAWAHVALGEGNTITFDNVEAGEYKFKITDGTWLWSKGDAAVDKTNSSGVTFSETDGDGNVVFSIASETSVTITYDAANDKILVVAPIVRNYHIAGSVYLTGLDWQHIELNEGNSITFNNVAAGDHEFKITDGTWDWYVSYAAENVDSENSNVTISESELNNNFKFTLDAKSNVTIAYNEETGKVTVNAEAIPEPKNVVILATYGNKLYAMSNTQSSDKKSFLPVEVEEDGANIVVPNAEAKAAIQWTKTAVDDNFTFQDANDKYLKGASNGGDLTLDDEACNWTWDETTDYHCYATGDRSFIYRASTYNVFKNYKISNITGNNTEYAGVEVRVIAPENIVVTSKIDPQLAYNPTSVTLTVGQTLVPAELTYVTGFDGLAAVTYESSNTDLATVEGGVVSIVADATGTATITATFAGNNNYLAGSASYTITVNEVGDDLSGTWKRVTAVAAGQKIIIAGTNGEETKAMGQQNTNPNRAAVLSELNGDILAPGAATKVFTLVDAGEGLFAIQASNGKYLSSATSGTGNNLVEADDYSLDNAKWTISTENDITSIVAAAGSKTIMQYNYNGGNSLFACYGSANQKQVKIYSTTEIIRGSLEAGKWGTICPKHEIQNPTGASFYTLTYADKNDNVPAAVYFDEIAENASLEAGKPYLFIADGAAIIGTKNGEATSVLQNYNGFTGVLAEDHRLYVDAVDAAAHKYYIIKGNKVQLCGEGYFTVPAERAYIDMSVVSTDPTSQAPGRRRVCLTNAEAQVATGFENINASEKPMKLMIDGQIYILRGEKLFDTTGRLVK